MVGIEIDGRRAPCPGVEAAGSSVSPLPRLQQGHWHCYLAGTSPDVQAMSVTRWGAGVSWMIRKYVLAANSVHGASSSLADGQLVRADRGIEPDTLLAIRGGGGANLAEWADAGDPSSYLHSPGDLRGMPLLADRARDRSSEGLARVGRHGLDECPSRLEGCCSLPDVHFLPEHLRGRSFVRAESVLRLHRLGGRRSSARQAVRDLEPEFDTVAMMPTSDLSLVNIGSRLSDSRTPGMDPARRPSAAAIETTVEYSSALPLLT